jgi:hypothetical protein
MMESFNIFNIGSLKGLQSDSAECSTEAKIFWHNNFYILILPTHHGQYMEDADMTLDDAKATFHPQLEKYDTPSR